jgi:exonuclease III
MMDVFQIASLNIKGLASRAKMAMLEDFLRREEIDILFLQEVTQPSFEVFLSYKTYERGEGRAG